MRFKVVVITDTGVVTPRPHFVESRQRKGAPARLNGTCKWNI